MVERVVRALTDARLLTSRDEGGSDEHSIEVAHIALIRGWPRLREWIDEDRAGLLVLRRLSDASREWDVTLRDEGFLYRGGRLAEAVEWQQRTPDALNQLERTFLEASIAAQNRERSARRSRPLLLAVTVVLGLLVLVLLVLVVFASTR